jgi:hypothetical protein
MPSSFGRAELSALARRLNPDNIAYRAPLCVERDGTLVAVLNPGHTAKLERESVCLGAIFDCVGAWWQVGSGTPDGTFALIRSDEDRTELLTDVIGTRTLWYTWTDHLFVASTSQRAIVMCLRSYAANPAVLPWQISSGTLGPGYSWDQRIRSLPPASRLLFDRRSWRGEVCSAPVEYRAASRSTAEHRNALRDAIAATFKGLELDMERWVLALSGGYDSRMMLLMLKNHSCLQTVTWGLREALADRRTDAHIARLLAAKLRTQHLYYEIDSSAEEPERVLDRFVRIGEGRTEHIGAYADGFAVWRRLHERGIDGVLRGDEAFGCRAAHNAAAVYRNMQCTTLADFQPDTAAPLAEILPPQRRPEHLERRAGESIESWRDRLNAEFEFPYVLAPLNDLKVSYVDVLHPLVSRRIVERVREMPDELRTNKLAFKSVVNSQRLGVPLATRTAVPQADVTLRESRVERCIRGELQAASGTAGVVGGLAARSLDLLARAEPTAKRPRSARRYLVSALRRRLHLEPKPTLDPRLVAFRTYIISRMQTVLDEDALALRRRND